MFKPMNLQIASCGSQISTEERLVAIQSKEGAKARLIQEMFLLSLNVSLAVGN